MFFFILKTVYTSRGGVRNGEAVYQSRLCAGALVWVEQVLRGLWGDAQLQVGLG